MFKRYLLSMLIATVLLLTACGGALPFSSPTATPIPFAAFTAQDVFDAFTAAGLSVQNPQSQMSAGRDEPGEFGERFVFEIPSIAPVGGQLIVFENPEQLAAWQAYIESLRNNSATRRTVIYVYVKNNVMVQLNSMLTNAEATAYREALEGITF